MTAPLAQAAPAPASDRRIAVRHPVRLVGHVAVHGLDSIAVTLTDISDSGCRIAQSDWLGDADGVTLTLDGFAAFECSVTWTSADATGLRFDERLHPAVLRQIVTVGQGRKRAQRLLEAKIVRRDESDRRWRTAQDIVVEARVHPRRPGERIAARLFDLSSLGCRISADTRLSPGMDVVVMMGAIDPAAAIVSWSDRRTAGLTFAHPIDPAVVERYATDPGTAG